MKKMLMLIFRSFMYLFAGLFVLIISIGVLSIFSNRSDVSKINDICKAYYPGEAFGVQDFVEKNQSGLERINIKITEGPNSEAMTKELIITTGQSFDFRTLPAENQMAGEVSFGKGFPMHGTCKIHFAHGKVLEAKQLNYD